MVSCSTSENRAVKFRIRRDLNKAYIRWQLVSGFNQQEIPWNDPTRSSRDLGSIPEQQAILGHHVCDGRHDLGRRPVLPCIEGSLYEEDSEQDYC